MGDSYIMMDAHQLRDLCTKAKDTVLRCRKHEVETFLNKEVMRENARRARWYARWFGFKPVDAAQMRKYYEDQCGFGESLHWHGLINRWSHVVEICDRLLATTHYTHNVHVSSVDLDYIHAWVK